MRLLLKARRQRERSRLLQLKMTILEAVIVATLTTPTTFRTLCLHMLRSDDSIQVIKEQCEMPDDVFPNTLSFGVSSEINHKKLQNIEHLVQKLTRLNSTHDEAHTDYIASLCENTKPDDRYILEILLASGILLRDLGSSLTTFQFHSSGHPINPELFLVLEQTKFSNLPKQEPSNKKLLNKEKFHRKLIFDTVNEVLAKKLALVVPSLESFSSKSFKLANNTLNGQKLLRDLCMEIEELLQVKKKKEDVSLDEEDDGLKTILWEEVLNHEESWTDYDSKLHVIALEVERLIFKDLVNEVVLGEASHDDSIQVIKEQCKMPNDVIPNILSFSVSSEINHKKLQNIMHLVQKLTRLNSTYDEAHTDYIASLCENTKPDNRYISEILLALGILLRDLGSSLTTFQFHSLGHPINLELFLVLEQTKFSNLPKQEPSNKKLLNKEKFHRKLIFDIVNEVLAKKLALVVPSLESFSSKSYKLANNTLNGKKLLRDLCMEIEELLQVKKKKEDVSLDEEDDGLKTILWEKVLNHEESWTDYDGELHVIALEVERLIFKDLVNEVVLGEPYHGDISGSTDIVKNQIAYCLIFSLIISLISNALSASPDTISILSHDASFSCYFQETVMVIGNDQLI
ncbi:longifolia 1-like protein [Tanacetum coccineum]